MKFLLILALLFTQNPNRLHPHPNTDPDEEGMEHQTLEGDVKVPRSGVITIPFFPPFKAPPTCEFKGATIPGEWPEVTAEQAKMKAKKHRTMHYQCRGVKK
jgi:hypothetical protein